MSAAASALTLRPMREDEWPAWHAHVRLDYVEHLVAMGGFTRMAAEAKGARDHAALLPDGMASPGHRFFMAEAGGVVVASLWLGHTEDRDLGPLLWVYDIETLPAHRRRGYARAVMHLAEAQARTLGYHRIGLNVFAGNAAAIALYRSLGYALLRDHPAGHNMVKELG